MYFVQDVIGIGVHVYRICNNCLLLGVFFYVNLRLEILGSLIMLGERERGMCVCVCVRFLRKSSTEKWCGKFVSKDRI